MSREEANCILHDLGEADGLVDARKGADHLLEHGLAGREEVLAVAEVAGKLLQNLHKAR